MKLEDNRDESEAPVAHVIRCGEEMLAAIEAELEGGVYLTGDWKGRPFHPMHRSLREKHAEEFRADLARLREVEASRLAGLAEVLGFERQGELRAERGSVG